MNNKTTLNTKHLETAIDILREVGEDTPFEPMDSFELKQAINRVINELNRRRRNLTNRTNEYY